MNKWEHTGKYSKCESEVDKHEENYECLIQKIFKVFILILHLYIYISFLKLSLWLIDTFTI